MKLSERGAIRSAIAEGGYHLYPAGRLIDLIQAGLQSDTLCGDFEPETTISKISSIPVPTDPHGRELFELDRGLLMDHLGSMAPEYDIESIFDRMLEHIPVMAKRYYGLEEFVAPRPRVLEYFFEGIRDLYRDADWFAFNVSQAESVELSVPVGIYFKRNQVSPGHPEFVTLHEANHAMQERTSFPEGKHHYVPWMDEGLADAFARLMLFRATNDENLLLKLKRFRTEVEVSDPRKSTYHYSEETAAIMLLRGRLPFVRALMAARKRDPESINYSLLAQSIREGFDPHIAIIRSCRATKVDSWRKKFDQDESRFRAQGDLDTQDLRALTLFLASERPCILPAVEYSAALWLNEHGVVPEASIPEDLRPGVSALAAKYFVIKKEQDGQLLYDPNGGGLSHRLGSGELRCTY